MPPSPDAWQAAGGDDVFCFLLFLFILKKIKKRKHEIHLRFQQSSEFCFVDSILNPPSPADISLLFLRDLFDKANFQTAAYEIEFNQIKFQNASVVWLVFILFFPVSGLTFEQVLH